MPSLLPQPIAEAQTASQLLQGRITAEIRKAGGWLSFADYMRLALYTPELGYYSGGSVKLGRGGDFVTAPELSPLFGVTVAQTIVDVLRQPELQGRGEVLEVGAGSGRLAAHVLGELARQGCLPRHYWILELSGELRARQQATLAELVPDFASRVVWVDLLPEAFTGVILGNEVLDAMPCHMVRHQAHDEWLERGVALDAAGGLVWADQAIASERLAEQANQLTVAGEYVTEIQLEAQGFVATLAQRLQKGLMLFFDYGFPAAEYYHPQRHMGTLMCHYQQHSHMDPFWWPGLNDITTHIDFSALFRVATNEGLQLEGYLTQGQYLLNAGLLERLAHWQSDPALYGATQKLIHPAEMGELFKVLALSRGIDPVQPLCGFQVGDDSGRL